MAPITNRQLGIVASWMRFINYALIPRFTLRDITVLQRSKGHVIALKLPCINGNSPQWLEGPTDDY